MKEYFKVTGYDNFIRDPKTNSIINTNMSNYKEYLIMKDIKSKEDQKVNLIEDEVINIKNDISEIKTLLKQFLKQ
jgi:hypothetical protein